MALMKTCETVDEFLDRIDHLVVLERNALDNVAREIKATEERSTRQVRVVPAESLRLREQRLMGSVGMLNIVKELAQGLR